MKNKFILFLAEAVFMVMELSASRLVSPYFGNSNTVWTAVIGVILLGCGVGNYAGGRLSEKKSAESLLCPVLAIASAGILLVVLLADPVLSLLSLGSSVTADAVRATVGAFLLFFPLSLLFGIVMPCILSEAGTKGKAAGRSGGALLAIQTLGGIFGTFLGGFFLIPRFGVKNILAGMAVMLLVLAFVSGSIEKSLQIVPYAAVILAASVWLVFSAGKEHHDCMDFFTDTQYGRVHIHEGTVNGDPVRFMDISGGFSSATWLDTDKKYELVYEYAKYYDRMFAAGIPVCDVAMIGGAAYQYPEYFVSHFSRNMDVIEIDGGVTALAKEYFFLDDALTEYGESLTIYTEDGRTFFNRNQKKYDAVLNDAFSGGAPVPSLTTLEFNQRVKESLNENGVYLVNCISSLVQERAQLLQAYVNTLRQTFQYVYIFDCNPDRGEEQTRNLMLVATDADIAWNGTLTNGWIFSGKTILTDDLCPVEMLEEVH